MHLSFASVLLLKGLLTLSAIPGADDTPPPPGTQQAECDPKTGVIYYVESDLRHVAAISSNGKILWVCEVVKSSEKRRDWIASIGLGIPGHVYQSPSAGGLKEEKGEDCIVIEIWVSGFRTATIDKKTGKVQFSGQVT